jgi:hypothetical protein
MYTGGVRIILLLLFTFCSERAFAIKTASSFDVSYGITNLSVTTTQTGTSQSPLVRTLSSNTGIEVNYNVALFDYRTGATMSFMQFLSSNIGSMPVNRASLGLSYHFIRVNGQRYLIDNGVEAKVWGISPALEMSVGLNKLSISDPKNPLEYNFTAAFVDVLPRLLLEIPLSSSALLLLRGGYMFSATGEGALFNVKYAGTMFSLGFRLTTL